MQFELDRVPLQLPRGAVLHITDGDGKSLRVVEGRVWVTQEGSLDDVFVDAGSSVTLQGSGVTLVTSEPSATSSATLVFDLPLAIRSRERAGFPWLAWPRNWLGASVAA